MDQLLLLLFSHFVDLSLKLFHSSCKNLLLRFLGHRNGADHLRVLLHFSISHVFPDHSKVTSQFEIEFALFEEFVREVGLLLLDDLSLRFWHLGDYRPTFDWLDGVGALCSASSRSLLALLSSLYGGVSGECVDRVVRDLEVDVQCRARSGSLVISFQLCVSSLE